MGKFHDRMDADMEIRGLSQNTRFAYLRSMRQFFNFVKRPPEQVTLEDIRRYQIHLIRVEKATDGKFNQVVAAIRFFFRFTLRKTWDIQQIPYQKKKRKLPSIPSQEKVTALLESLKNPKHRAILMTMYAGGLRVGEVVRLKVSDIDSERMVIRVEQGKGRKDRYVMLSPRLLEVLREYAKGRRLEKWLFPGRGGKFRIRQRSVSRIVKDAQQAAGLDGRFYPHLLRHSFATHLLENGTNICVIQKLLGHRSLKSTSIYTHVAKNYLQETSSPFDGLPKAGPSVKA